MSMHTNAQTYCTVTALHPDLTDTVMRHGTTCCCDLSNQYRNSPILLCSCLAALKGRCRFAQVGPPNIAGLSSMRSQEGEA